MRDVTGLEDFPVDHALGDELDVGCAIREGGQRGVGRGRHCVAVVCAFLSVSSTFAFVDFAFRFSFSFALSFAFGVKRVVATARGGFSRHITILIQEI